jgi:transposase
MEKDRAGDTDKWSDQYDATKSAAQAIIDSEIEKTRARTIHLREQRALQTPIEAPPSVKPSVEHRRSWPDDLKQEILREVAVGDAAISDIARRHNVPPQRIYAWQKKFGGSPRQADVAMSPAADMSEREGAEATPSMRLETARPDIPGKNARVKIGCRGGRILKVDADIAPALLKMLIRTVEEA